MSVQFVLQPTANPAALFPASIVQTPVSRASTSLTTLHPIEQGPRLGFDSKPNFVGTLPVPGTTLHLAPDQEIYGEGDEARSLFQVVSGVVRTCKFLDDGRRQIDAFYVAGDVFGVEPGTEYRLSAEAVSEVTLVSYRRTSLEKVATTHATILPQLFAYALQEMARAQDHAHLLGRKGAMEKAATFLMTWSRHWPKAQIVTLAMTRQDIADYHGLTIETVSRSLSQLERDKVIELTTARQFHVKDRAALRDLAA